MPRQRLLLVLDNFDIALQHTTVRSFLQHLAVDAVNTDSYVVVVVVQTLPARDYYLSISGRTTITPVFESWQSPPLWTLSMLEQLLATLTLPFIFEPQEKETFLQATAEIGSPGFLLHCLTDIQSSEQALACVYGKNQRLFFRP